jgi:3-methyladenine DNA glycosylase/8-oxoguanine DNA glycosylase
MKDVPTTEHKSTMLELATKIDAAIRDEAARRKAVDVARVGLDTATQEHTAAVSALTALHGEYQTFMDNVLSVDGTVHVAKP